MKTLGLALIMGLIALGANAGTSAGADLLDYQRPGYSILSKTTLADNDIPNKGVYTKYGTVYTDITNICIEGNEFQTIQDVRICSEWGYKPKRCDDGDSAKNCFDRDERVCNAYAHVPGSSLVKGTKQVCARKTDKESREWRRRYNDDKKFKTDFPNCSVFKTVSANSPTSFDFLIVKDGGKNRPNYRRSLGGVLVDEITFTYPSCN